MVFVLEGLGAEAGVKGQDKVHPVTKLDVPERQTDDSLYRLQVSGKRNHTYYVNVALKVLARRQWNTAIELSGLGNGTACLTPLHQPARVHPPHRDDHPLSLSPSLS